MAVSATTSNGRGVWVENTALLPAEETQRLQGEVDSLLLLDTRGQHPSRVPAKLFEYVQVGRPILACTVKGLTGGPVAGRKRDSRRSALCPFPGERDRCQAQLFSEITY